MSQPPVIFPEAGFYLFGLGRRRKMLYQGGVLRDALNGEPIRQWDVARQEIDWRAGRVTMEAADGRSVEIVEDEEGVWLTTGRDREAMAQSPVTLPDFGGRSHASLLPALLREVLVNIVPAGPVPNLFVYRRPWYRDAAMVCMVLQRTGNLHLVEDWIASLRRPFDLNNAGNREPDNLGQLLYMISLVSDRTHPLVDVILREVERCRAGRHIAGITDGSAHPVYQTKWLKLGLRALHLADDFEIPPVADSYSSLFWMDFRDEHVPAPPLRRAGPVAISLSRLGRGPLPQRPAADAACPRPLPPHLGGIRQRGQLPGDVRDLVGIPAPPHLPAPLLARGRDVPVPGRDGMMPCGHGRRRARCGTRQPAWHSSSLRAQALVYSLRE
ncbi:MAG TPA: hypothetical protein VM389_13035 [Phycisphaerae bacterium]|nr:hypothetical protein [Phycisphaerae bacterium]